MKRNESGRSMVEMIAVLAIMGVLSIGGVAGYGHAGTCNNGQCSECSANNIGHACSGGYCNPEGVCDNTWYKTHDGCAKNIEWCNYSPQNISHSFTGDPCHGGSGTCHTYPSPTNRSVTVCATGPVCGAAVQ